MVTGIYGAPAEAEEFHYWVFDFDNDSFARFQFATNDRDEAAKMAIQIGGGIHNHKSFLEEKDMLENSKK